MGDPSANIVINPETGLTPEEDHVLTIVSDLWGAWMALPVQHPNDLGDICNAVHTVQQLLAIRIARRAFPTTWRSYELSDVEAYIGLTPPV